MCVEMVCECVLIDDQFCEECVVCFVVDCVVVVLVQCGVGDDDVVFVMKGCVDYVQLWYFVVVVQWDVGGYFFDVGEWVQVVVVDEVCFELFGESGVYCGFVGFVWFYYDDVYIYIFGLMILWMLMWLLFLVVCVVM